MKLSAGEVWAVNGRKGRLCIKLQEDVDTEVDTFFKAEIRDGRARFMSEMYQDAQTESGLGTRGTVLDFRTSLTIFLRRVDK